MKEDDLLYGCHSAVQKAVRRGDLDLAKTSFEAMWPHSKHRNWLKWRMLVLVEEDVYQMLGEWSRFIREKPQKEDEWRRFLYRLVVSPKSKDTESLLWVAMQRQKREKEHPELEEMRFWLSMMDDGDPGAVVGDLVDELKGGKFKDLSDYELGAISVLQGRVRGGGMLADRQACLGAMILVAMRGLDEKAVSDAEVAGLTRHLSSSGGRKPRTVNLPWYAFDMHTQVGKISSSVFVRSRAAKYPGLTKEKFEDIWFYLESAYVPSDQIKFSRYSKDAKLKQLDNMWWPVLVRDSLKFGGYTAKQTAELWRTKWKAEMESIVNWCIEKRSSD